MIPEEQDALLFTLGPRGWLNPLAPSSALPQALDEPDRSTLSIRAIMFTHNLLYSFRRLIRVIEWDGGYIVVEDVSFDDAVEDIASNKAKLTVDGCGSPTDIGP